MSKTYKDNIKQYDETLRSNKRASHKSDQGKRAQQKNHMRQWVKGASVKEDE